MREDGMKEDIKFQAITDFPRGTLASMLFDAYSFDRRCAENWGHDWKTFDDFFYDNSETAERYGFITVVNGEPAGFASWDPRHRPDYMEIGHNCIITKYKRHGYGTLQMKEAIRRAAVDKPYKIIVTTSELMIPAQKMYQGAGFRKSGTRKSRIFRRI